MGNIFGALGRGLSNAGEAAVKASPYALNAVMQVKAEKDADLQKALQQLYQRNADNRAEMASSIAYSNQIGSRELNDARVQALRNPSVGVQYIPDANGNLVAMPKKIGGVGSAQEMPGPSVTPSGDPSQAPAQGPGGVRPIATGVRVMPKANPLDELTPHNFTVNGQNVAGFADKRGNYFDSNKQPVHGGVTPYAPPVAPTIIAGQNSDGTPGIFRVPKMGGDASAVGGIAPRTTTAAGSAPMSAKIGQAGEMLKKAGDLLPMMEGLGVSLGQSASADIAQNGLGVGHARIPGTKGIGNALLNNNATYAQYQAALSPFVLAAAHALSGARINQDQATQIRQSVEIAPRDITNPSVMKQKMKNMIDLVNSINGSLPPDAIAAQEGQIDPTTITRLEGYGYRRATAHQSPIGGRGGATATAPSGAAPKAGKPTASDYGIFSRPPE